MAVVLRQIAEALVGVEQKVFVPTVANAFHHNGAPLETNHLVEVAAHFSARAQGNERMVRLGGLELLENLEIGVFGVQDRVATAAHHGNRLFKRPDRQRRPAARDSSVPSLLEPAVEAFPRILSPCLPALKATEVLELKVFEFHGLAEEQ